MATADSAPASQGMSYAPEDPTLPKPWKGVIDGSTGLLYYWNPETNVTQYEKPPPLAPPSVADAFLASTPKLAPIPSARSVPPNGNISQQQQPSHHMPYQQTQQMPNQPAHMYPHMQMNHMAHPSVSYMKGQVMPSPQSQQQGMPTGHQQGQQLGHQQGQIGLQQGQQLGHQQGQIGHQQGQQIGFSMAGGGRRQEGNHMGFTASHIQQVGDYSVGPQQQIGGPSSISTQHDGTIHRQQPMSGPTIPNQMGHGMVHPVVGPKMGYGDDHQGRVGNEYYLSNSKEGPAMLQQPKLAAIPHTGNRQDIRVGGINVQTGAPSHSGGLNIAPEFAMSKMHDRAAFPNVPPTGPSPRMLASSDFSNISAADAYRQHHEVTATGDNVPAPFSTFEATGFPPEILREIHGAGFLTPTPIQAQTWPIAMQKRDIVAIAKTGSGKTLGYLLPAFMHLKRCRNNPQIGPTVLVLSPTRELATQIQDEAIKFGRTSRISCTCLYGGAPKGPQLKEIERGADIVVATPGRLNDILEMKKINFCQVSFLVLDEADRMLDMGFEPQIRKIVNEIPPRRQTLMYTATWPKEVRKIAGDLLMNPVQVNIGSVDVLAANKSITQYVEMVSPMEKQRRLEQILRTQERGSKIIIFCSTKRLCDQLARSIGRSFGAAAIHGDKSQGERDHVLNQFRSGKAPILVATDVAARGLDIKDIRVVVNYDFPTGIEDYVHRIGRTGRAGATGVSYTFISDQDWKHAADLVKLLEGANQIVPPEVREMAARGGPGFSRGRGGVGRWDSGGGRGMRDGGSGGRWDSGGGRGMRDGGGGSRRWDSGGGRGMRDGGGGPGGFGGRAGRNDFLGGGRGNRGRGFGRHEMQGRGRFDGRRGFMDRNRDRSYSRSPERVRTWGYDRSRSNSRSRSRSRSRSWSRSRSRSWSRSPSIDRSERPRVRRPSGFDAPLSVLGSDLPILPNQDNGSFSRDDSRDLLPVPDGAVVAEAGAEPAQEAVVP